MSQSVHLEEERNAYAREVSLHGKAADPPSPPHRPHPYNRRPSLPLSHIDVRTPRSADTEGDGRDVPRTMPGGHSQPINIPSISSLALGNNWEHARQREGYWEERERLKDVGESRASPMSRNGSGDMNQHLRLPPLHSLGSSDPRAHSAFASGPTMPPPPRPRTNPPSPRFAYNRSSSPRISTSQSLRPSFSSQGMGSAAMNGEGSKRVVPRESSPPLRSVHSFGPPISYPPSPEKYYPIGMGYNGSSAPHRGYPHAHHDMHARPPNYPMYANGPRRPEEEKPSAPGAGQSRRLAHLMSEQKRRESINTGFLALRRVVPAAAATDSKAVILRKAASHIVQLESMLRAARDDKRRPSGSRRDVEMMSDDGSRRPDSGDGEGTSQTSGSDRQEVKLERDESEEEEWE